MKTSSQKLNLNLDLRWVSLALLATSLGLLLAWHPWDRTSSGDRETISVTGESTVKAQPDEYAFMPSYQFTETTQQAAIDAAAVTSKEITAKLKDLGVKDNRIKSDTSGYQDYRPVDSPTAGRPGISLPSPPAAPNGYIYTLQLTVTLDSLDAAQKIQDYLASTGPTGSVSPYPTFSQALRKKLESQARDAATKDARTKAEQSAKNLGFKVGSVKSVNDSNGNNFWGQPMQSDIKAQGAPDIATRELAVQPGENDLRYDVTVEYYIK
ncbi:MAG TPA: SIMPL domain-containing protein [Candidatus Saccharimonadales bacterium]|jgi:uncharacterized protein YggE